MKRFLLLFIIFPFVSFSSDEDIFKAMDLEIKRAMEGLRVENLQNPYYISLRLKDIKIKTINFSFGFEGEKEESNYRNLSTVVRVGTPEFDQTNFSSSFDFGFYYMDYFTSAPIEDDLLSLRQAFWLSIDSSFKDAQEKFSKKKGFIEHHPQEKYYPDFVKIEKPFVYIDKVTEPLDFSKIYNISKNISSYLLKFDFLNDSNVTLFYLLKKQYFYDSEGSKHLRIEPIYLIQISFECFSSAFYPLSLNTSFVFRDSIPSEEEIKKEIDELADYLKAIKEKEPMDSYSGPVIFEGQGSGSFFLSLLGKGVSSVREPLSEQSYSMPFKKGGFLGKKLNQKIMPSGFDVWDKPNLKEYNGIKLIGYFPVDDEGVKAEDIQIVKEGKLINLPMRRTAFEDYINLNGHGREGQFTIISTDVDSTVTNLIIEDKNGLAKEEFFKKVEEYCQKEGIEKVLIIKKLKKSFSMSDLETDIFSFVEGLKGALSSPMVMYLYDIKTKMKEPVWGLEFSSISENVLKDILFSTKEQFLNQVYEFLSMDSLAYSVIAPEMVLIDDLSLKKTKVQRIKKPLVEMP